MRVLLTGGAGYIGSHTAVALAESGHTPLIIDDLTNSRMDAFDRISSIVGHHVPHLEADIRDTDTVVDFLDPYAPIDGVIHFAGLKSVAESVQNPTRYYDVNIGTTLSVLEIMSIANIDTLVFSSSATVYGDDPILPAREDRDAGLRLANPYGKSKRMIEEIIKDASAARPMMRAVSLRYFNPVGAHPSGIIGEDPLGTPNNIMPIILRAASGALESVSVFGNDYPTPDGTCLRDYIHVLDLAEGHVRALEHSSTGYSVYNLGTGEPVSVIELLDTFSQATQQRVPVTYAGRRPGDVPVSYADPDRARADLDWSATRTVREACIDSWNAYQVAHKRTA